MRKLILFISITFMMTGCSNAIRGCNGIYLTKTVKTDCSGSKADGSYSCESYECPSLFD